MEQDWIEKMAIQELFARYAHAIDDLKPEAWVACFHPDGVFQVGRRAMQGQAALRGYADVHVREIRCRHMMANFLYRVEGEQASGQCSMLATLATPGGYKIFAQGRYLDRLVKHAGEWRIAHRRVETDRDHEHRRPGCCGPGATAGRCGTPAGRKSPGLTRASSAAQGALTAGEAATWPRDTRVSSRVASWANKSCCGGVHAEQIGLLK